VKARVPLPCNDVPLDNRRATRRAVDNELDQRYL
jgi:hypothetical protein